MRICNIPVKIQEMKLKRALLQKSWIPAFAGMTIIVFVMSFSVSFSYAQISTSIQGIDLKLSNDSPTPGQNITVTAESYVSDLNSSNITWKVNGVAFQKGVGVTSIVVQAPSLGKNLTINITAVTPEGKTMTNNVTLTSGNVDLILESQGYTPPFFAGKIPLAYQNTYRIVAVPHLADASGKEYDPQTLEYQWTKDSRVVQDQSGYGKQVFTWKDEVVPRQRIVDLKVFTRDGKEQAEKFIAIEAGAPSIAFYKDDSVYGTFFNTAVSGNLGLGKGGEVSVLAVPFGFNKPAGSLGDLSFSWLLNSVEQDSLSANQSITLRAPSDQSGSSDIQLTVTNTQDFLEKAAAGFSANFIQGSSQAAAASNSNGI